MRLPTDVVRLCLACLPGDQLLYYLYDTLGLHANRHTNFTASLPLITGAQNHVHEENVEQLILLGNEECVVYQIGSATRTRVRLETATGRLQSQILVSGNVQDVVVKNFIGQQLFRMDALLFHILKNSEGQVDLMTYIHHLPCLPPHNCYLDLYTIDGMTVTSLTQQCGFDPHVRTETLCESFEKFSLFQASAQKVIDFDLQMSFISNGIIICCESMDGVLCTGVLRSVRLTLTTKLLSGSRDDFDGKIQGAFVARGAHYFVNLAGRINSSRVDKMHLALDFHEPFLGCIHFYNHYNNMISSADGMIGVKFSV